MVKQKLSIREEMIKKLGRDKQLLQVFETEKEAVDKEFNEIQKKINERKEELEIEARSKIKIATKATERKIKNLKAELKKVNAVLRPLEDKESALRREIRDLEYLESPAIKVFQNDKEYSDSLNQRKMLMDIQTLLAKKINRIRQHTRY